jgi:hypothetical protein
MRRYQPADQRAHLGPPETPSGEPVGLVWVPQEDVQAVLLTAEDHVGVLTLAAVVASSHSDRGGLRTGGQGGVEVGVAWSGLAVRELLQQTLKRLIVFRSQKK